MAINYQGRDIQKQSELGLRLEDIISYDYSAYDSGSGEGAIEIVDKWLVADNLLYSSSVEFDKESGEAYSASYFLPTIINVSGAFYGSLSGTATSASYVLSASYAPTDSSSLYNAAIFSNPYLILYKGDGSGTILDLSTLTVTSASYALTASYITGSIFSSTNPALSSSYATTASFLLGSVTSASFASTASLLTGRLSTYRSFGTGSTVGTGTTSLLATTSFLIPANTFTTGDILRVRYRVRKLATGGNSTTGIYINTTNDISTATTLGILTANTTSLQMKRDFYILAATGINTEHVGVGTSLATDDVATGRAASTINWAVDQYIIFGIQHTNTGDSGYSTMYYLERV